MSSVCIGSFKTLKLDSSYRPLEVIDAVEALVLCLIGKASAVEQYEHRINSPSSSWQLPAVIVLQRIVKFRFDNLRPIRRNVIERDNYQCQYCEETFPVPELTMDHIIPKSRGGKNTWENLTTACKKCNQKKKDRTPAESGM